MTEKTKKGYLTEINYQKHMLKNLHRFMSLSFLISTISLTLLYFFHSNIIEMIVLCTITVIGLLAVLIFAYGIQKGRNNVNRVIDEFETLSRS